jgi:hypothetical protein
MTSRKSKPIVNSRGTLSSHSVMASNLFGGCKDGPFTTLGYRNRNLGELAADAFANLYGVGAGGGRNGAGVVYEIGAQ